MPAISMFYGIIIKMYNNGEHNPPHFHASYQGYYATFNLDGELIEGDMPKRLERQNVVCSTEQLSLSMVFFIKRIVASEKALTSLVKKAGFLKDN